MSFDGLAQLAPKADTTYRVRVKALRPGDLRARFQLLTDDMQSPGDEGREHAGVCGRIKRSRVLTNRKSSILRGPATKMGQSPVSGPRTVLS